MNDKEKLIELLGNQDVLDALERYLSNRRSFWKIIKKIKWWR
jgi:hypothetical protein